MQASFHPSSGHSGGWVLALVGVSVVSGLVLVAVSVRQSRRMNLIHEWRVGGRTGNVFQGANEWADINEDADRPPTSADSNEERSYY